MAPADVSRHGIVAGPEGVPSCLTTGEAPFVDLHERLMGERRVVPVGGVLDLELPVAVVLEGVHATADGDLPCRSAIDVEVEELLRIPEVLTQRDPVVLEPTEDEAAVRLDIGDRLQR